MPAGLQGRWPARWRFSGTAQYAGLLRRCAYRPRCPSLTDRFRGCCAPGSLLALNWDRSSGGACTGRPMWRELGRFSCAARVRCSCHAQGAQFRYGGANRRCIRVSFRATCSSAFHENRRHHRCRQRRVGRGGQGGAEGIAAQKARAEVPARCARQAAQGRQGQAPAQGQGRAERRCDLLRRHALGHRQDARRQARTRHPPHVRRRQPTSSARCAASTRSCTTSTAASCSCRASCWRTDSPTRWHLGGLAGGWVSEFARNPTRSALGVFGLRGFAVAQPTQSQLLAATHQQQRRATAPAPAARGPSPSPAVARTAGCRRPALPG